jgi:hypothetical protein
LTVGQSGFSGAVENIHRRTLSQRFKTKWKKKSLRSYLRRERCIVAIVSRFHFCSDTKLKKKKEKKNKQKERHDEGKVVQWQKMNDLAVLLYSILLLLARLRHQSSNTK